MAKYDLLLELNNVLSKIEKHYDKMIRNNNDKESIACTNCEFAHYGRYVESGCVYADVEGFGTQDMIKRIIKKNEEEITLERRLKFPSIYRHFKGGLYAIVGISKPVENNELDKIFTEIGCIGTLDIFDYRFGSRHTELNEDIIIYKDNKGNFYHHKKNGNEDLVIYKTLYDGSGAFSRPIDMFLSEVDKEKYPNIAQEHRFEEV